MKTIAISGRSRRSEVRKAVGGKTVDSGRWQWRKNKDGSLRSKWWYGTFPMELVRRVTGHSTVNIVLDHYFRPGREEFRKAIEGAMSKMLTDDPGVAAEKPLGQQIREICARVLTRDPSTRSGQAWKQDVAQIDALAAKLPA